MGLLQVMVCRLLGAKHYVSLWWRIVNWILKTNFNEAWIQIHHFCSGSRNWNTRRRKDGNHIAATKYIDSQNGITKSIINLMFKKSDQRGRFIRTKRNKSYRFQSQTNAPFLAIVRRCLSHKHGLCQVKSFICVTSSVTDPVELDEKRTQKQADGHCEPPESFYHGKCLGPFY